MIEFELERLLKDAKNDENLKSELIKTKSSENPVRISALSAKARATT